MWKPKDPQFYRANWIAGLVGGVCALVVYSVLMWLLKESFEGLPIAVAFLVYLLVWDFVLSWVLRRTTPPRKKTDLWL